MCSCIWYDGHYTTETLKILATDAGRYSNNKIYTKNEKDCIKNVGCMVILLGIINRRITHLASCSSMHSKEGKDSDREDAGGNVE